jgi:acyl carrier protein
MDAENIDVTVREAIREIVADIVEVDVEKVGWNSNFWDELGADSMQGIEILAALERHFKINIDQVLLPTLQDVQRTYDVVAAAMRDAGSDAV